MWPESLLAEFDYIVESAPVDFLETGSCSRHAAKEEREWQERIDSFRKSLVALIATVPTKDTASG